MKRLLLKVLVLAILAGSAWLGWMQINSAGLESAFEQQVLSAAQVTDPVDPPAAAVLLPLLPGRVTALDAGSARRYAFIAAGSALIVTLFAISLQRVHPARVIASLLAQVMVTAAGAGLGYLTVTQLCRMLNLTTVNQFFAWRGALPVMGALLLILLLFSGLLIRRLIDSSTHPISAAFGALLTLALLTAAAAWYRSSLVGLFGVPLTALLCACLIAVLFVRWRTPAGLVLFAPFACLSLMEWLPAAYALSVTAGLAHGYLALLVLAGIGFTSLFMGMSLMSDAGAVPAQAKPAPRRPEPVPEAAPVQPRHAAPTPSSDTSAYARPAGEAAAQSSAAPRHRRSERYH